MAGCFDHSVFNTHKSWLDSQFFGNEAKIINSTFHRYTGVCVFFAVSVT